MKKGLGLRARRTSAPLSVPNQDASGDREQAAEREAPVATNTHSGRPVRELLRTGGRVVLWAFLVVVLVRGLGDIASGPERRPSASPGQGAVPRFPDAEAEAFAVRFARVYLDWEPGRAQRHARTVGSYLASGLRDRVAVEVPRRGPGERVAQATVARSTDLGSGRALITVACSFSDGATRYLTVPVARDRGGGLAVFDLPSLSAPPPAGEAPAAEPQPLSGTEAGAMTDVVRRFLSTYLAGGGPSDLAYFLVPGASVTPMPPGLQVVSLEQVGQAGPATASGVPAVASVRVRDRSSGAVYPLRYRLELVRRDRWYVAALGGGA